MSITVKFVDYEGSLEIRPYLDGKGEEVKGVYVHTAPVRIFGKLERNGKIQGFVFEVMPGYIGNFASSPDLAIVQALVPSYVEDDVVYNEGFDLHDWLYSRKGLCTSGETLERSEVDDLARGIMRLSPTLKKNKKWYARLRCSIMDLSVGLFAGNKRHWGNDTYSSKPFATFDLVEV